MSCPDYKQLIKGCELPSKHTNNQYKRIIEELKETKIADDKNVKEALDELSKISVSEAFKEIRAFNSKSGGKRRKTRYHKRRGGKKTRKHNRSNKKGGALGNKKKCYLKATGILISIVGSSIISAQMLILPSIMATLPKPCEGVADQTIGFLLGKVNPDYSCVARQQMIQTFINNITSYITQSIGVGTVLAIFNPTTFISLMKSSKKFSSKVFKYLLHQVCPKDYEAPDFSDLADDIKSAVEKEQTTAQPPRSPPKSTAAPFQEGRNSPPPPPQIDPRYEEPRGYQQDYYPEEYEQDYYGSQGPHYTSGRAPY